MKQNDKPSIDYPCEWSYRLIGRDKTAIEAFVLTLFKNRVYDLDESNRRGRFISLKLSVIVDSELDREDIFARLKASQDITTIL